MAVRDSKGIMDLLGKVLEGNTTDDALSLVEDVKDTLADFDTRASGMEDWKSKYEKNDKEWRERYKARFFDGETVVEKAGEEIGGEPEKEEPTTYEELFKEE